MINENAANTIPPQLPVEVSNNSISFRRLSWEIFRQPTLHVRRIHLLTVAGLVAAADLLLYQGGGALAGWAAWSLSATALLIVGIAFSQPTTFTHYIHPLHSPTTFTHSVRLVGLSIIITALRLLWQGSHGLVLISILQLSVFALLLHGVPMGVAALARFFLRWLPQGCRCLPPSLFSSSGLGVNQWRWLEYGIPLMITSLFAAIFLMANPDAVSRFIGWLGEFSSFAENWLMTLRPGQPMLWILVIVLGLGMIVPPWKDMLDKSGIRDQHETIAKKELVENRDIHIASRNTLVALILLFVGYLAVEFATMWFRKFPEGFHYSGYAHAGAAWLTVALALATIVISAVCRPVNFGTSGYESLLKLSRVWSILNLLLAICVFNRLSIYIDYNGMTRMRVVAILGVCCVVVGFALVMLKSTRGLSFAWLVDRQLTALALFVYLLAVMPVDWLVYSYNCRKVIEGNQSPAVQITEHQLSSSAVHAVLPLVRSEDPIIAQGVSALVAERLEEIRNINKWQQFQLADYLLHQTVNQDRNNAEILDFIDKPQAREVAINRFKQLVWKWY